ncbi:hypothetical protein BH10CYA1_BH10CYA1_23200 [soil metagenome]
MGINRASNSNQNLHSMGIFELTEASTLGDESSVDNQISRISDLDHALRLAAQFHLGGLHATDEQLCSLVKRVKNLAMLDLERGDGRKVESVRVERRLDGSISIFFGI